GAIGENPRAGLVSDSEGNLYGTTTAGGASGDGTIFELAAGSDTVTTLASFNGTNGAIPFACMIIDNDGNLYGTTSLGGIHNDGTIFELPAGSSTIVTLATFNSDNGAQPEGGLIVDSAGNFYGTTTLGGLGDDGTIFELAKGASTITTLAYFNGSRGA